MPEKHIYKDGWITEEEMKKNYYYNSLPIDLLFLPFSLFNLSRIEPPEQSIKLEIIRLLKI